MKYAAFLRGINVGGKNKVKMETLREVCVGLGFENVKTYINSGNIIFDARADDEAAVAKEIEKGIETAFGLAIKTIVRTIPQIEAIVADNPFAGQFESHKDLHVFFLDEELPDEKRDLLFSYNNDDERYAVRGREIFCLLRISILESLMGRDFIGKKLKVAATSRNWRTVNKVLEF